MRVLHLGNEMSWRGGENQVRLLIQGLKAQNIFNMVAYPRTSRGIERFADVADVVVLPSRQSWDIRNVFAICKIIDQNKITIIDAHSSVALTWAHWVKKMRPQVKVVMHRRVDNRISGNPMTRAKYLGATVDKFVAISSAIGKILENYGVPQTKLSVVKSAVSAAPYEKLVKTDCRKLVASQVSANAIWIGYAGAMTLQKDPMTFIQGAEKVISQNPNVQFFLAGDGELFLELKNYIQEKNLLKNIHLLGHLDNVNPFLKALDILAIPSRNEGLGTIFLDGALAGAALIGTDVGGIPEIIKNKETGLLISGLSEGATVENIVVKLAEAMQSLINSESLRKTCTEGACRFVKENFSLEKMVSGNLKVYQEISG